MKRVILILFHLAAVCSLVLALVGCFADGLGLRNGSPQIGFRDGRCRVNFYGARPRVYHNWEGAGLRVHGFPPFQVGGRWYQSYSFEIAWAYFLPIPVAAALLAVRRRQRLPRLARELLAGRCLSCGYDLRATPGHCTECGGIQPIVRIEDAVAEEVHQARG